MNALRTLLAADINKAVLFASCVSGRARKIVASRASPLFAVNCALDAIEAFEAAVMASAGMTPSSTDVAAAALRAAAAGRAAAAATAVGSDLATLASFSRDKLLAEADEVADRAAKRRHARRNALRPI